MAVAAEPVKDLCRNITWPSEANQSRSLSMASWTSSGSPSINPLSGSASKLPPLGHSPQAVIATVLGPLRSHRAGLARSGRRFLTWHRILHSLNATLSHLPAP